MFAIKIVSLLNKSLFTKIKAVTFPIKNIRHKYLKTKHPVSLDLRSQVKNDVVLFQHDKPKFFLAINVFSAVQCAVWSYLGWFLFTSLKHSTFQIEGQKIFKSLLEKERKYSDFLTVMCFLFGWIILIGTCFYSMRSIRKIILHRGGSEVTVATYGLPGFNEIRVPLREISSLEHRSKAKKYIPLKLKKSLLYYLIDVRGEFAHPNLFDFTVGVKRGL